MCENAGPVRRSNGYRYTGTQSDDRDVLYGVYSQVDSPFEIKAFDTWKRRRRLRLGSFQGNGSPGCTGAIFPNGLVTTLTIGSVKQSGPSWGHKRCCKLKVIHRSLGIICLPMLSKERSHQQSV